MYAKPKKNNLIKTIFISILVFTILEIVFYSLLQFMQKKIINNYLVDYTKNITKELNYSRNSFVNYSKLFFDTVVNKKEIIDIMQKASQSKNKNELSVLRNELYKMLNSEYQTFRKQGIKQFHFHLPNSVSFLRFHKPSHFADDLKDYRESINFVNKNQINISIFEVGKHYHGFRNVFPIYKNNIFVGTVEISYPFQTIKKEFLAVSQTSLDFIIKRKIVEEKVTENSKKNYIKSPYKDYLYSNQIEQQDNMQLSLEELKVINNQLADSVMDRLNKEKAFSSILEKHHHNEKSHHAHIITYMPIDDIDGKTSAFLIHYAYANFIELLQLNYYIILFASTLLNILFSSFLAMILHKHNIRLYEADKTSKIDALTSIYNRLGVDNRFENELEHHKRCNIESAIIFFDIDHFKEINDTYGHQIGDFVLMNLVKIVSKFLRKTDIFGRWGGEEFIIILPNTNLKEASNVAEKLRTTIEKHNFFEIGTLTCSFGVTSILKNDNYDSAIKRVDSLMYQAKNEGRNKVKSSIEES